MRCTYRSKYSAQHWRDLLAAFEQTLEAV